MMGAAGATAFFFLLVLHWRCNIFVYVGNLPGLWVRAQREYMQGGDHPKYSRSRNGLDHIDMGRLVGWLVVLPNHELIYNLTSVARCH
ncbi:uncharacterized protein GGS22DRAFT_125628 [Annulohypoxylon maeteangense]|uniref:uncharacterized protein n=1 Tax=Annulohypoxylon maeteangense TaxID=1927788 RepID=UPI002007A070|nr:uncharacterized protein GGS22DRAFT_125628 [Annulohypoxylon maeteangense]KAI0886190.1 hypothetical protein GGS22DRAFT_125628 [Annulohypoxylon maeteangense]